jgi:hypothetical protein
MFLKFGFNITFWDKLKTAIINLWLSTKKIMKSAQEKYGARKHYRENAQQKRGVNREKGEC